MFSPTKGFFYFRTIRILTPRTILTLFLNGLLQVRNFWLRPYLEKFVPCILAKSEILHQRKSILIGTFGVPSLRRSKNNVFSNIFEESGIYWPCKNKSVKKTLITWKRKEIELLHFFFLKAFIVFSGLLKKSKSFSQSFGKSLVITICFSYVGKRIFSEKKVRVLKMLGNCQKKLIFAIKKKECVHEYVKTSGKIWPTERFENATLVTKTWWHPTYVKCKRYYFFGHEIWATWAFSRKAKTCDYRIELSRSNTFLTFIDNFPVFLSTVM